MKRAITTILLILIAAGLATGCAKIPPRVALPREGGRVTQASQRITAHIEAHRRATASVRALAFLLIGDADEERQTEAAVAVVRPDKIRVDAMDQLADVWAQAGSDGQVMWLHLTAKQRLYSGKASIQNLHRVAKFDFEVWELADILAGSPPVKPDVLITEVGRGKDAFFLAAEKNLSIWSDDKQSRISKVVRMGVDGASVEYSIVYGDYQKVSGHWFPHRIEARFPSRGARAVIQYKSVELGSEQDPQTFLPPKRGGSVKVQDLDKP